MFLKSETFNVLPKFVQMFCFKRKVKHFQNLEVQTNQRVMKDQSETFESFTKSIFSIGTFIICLKMKDETFFQI